MRKTSVYLTEDEAEGLRQLAAREGRPQAELIREGVRKVIGEAGERPRRFRSLGIGHGRQRGEDPGEERPVRWTSDELYRKAMGER